MLRKASEICSREGASNSGDVDTPAESRSCIYFNKTAGTESSVARIVSRII